MRAAYDAPTPDQGQIEDLITEHSLLSPAASSGSRIFTAEERVQSAPVRHRLVRTNPTTGRNRVPVVRHRRHCRLAGAEAMAFVRDLVKHATEPAIRLRPRLAAA